MSRVMIDWSVFRVTPGPHKTRGRSVPLFLEEARQTGKMRD
jgi:hypothetical protein